jgi:carboxypeptidase Q
MRTVFITSLMICSVVVAQEPMDRDMIARIRDEGMNRSRVLEFFMHFTEDIGPRLTGSPAYKVAATYARDRLAEFGLASPYMEAWEFGRGWTLEKFSLELTGPRYMPLIGYPEGWSPSTAGELNATPLYLGDKTQDAIEAMRDKIKGAIVLGQPIQTSFEREDRLQPTLSDAPVPIGQPRPRNVAPPLVMPQNLTRILREAGAGLVLRPNRGEHGTLFVLGRDGGEGSVPSVVVSAEQYNMIARMIQRGLPVKLRANVQTRFYTDDKSGYNILAELPGSDPVLRDEIVMIGGHLDSWHSATGAADNADGAATVMEAMRILKAIGARPKRTIRVAIWGGEEQGLLGSQKYVEKYLKGEANKAARDKFDVYFNIDPGTGPIYGWYMENNESAKAIFDAWLAPFKDMDGRRNIIQGIGNTDHLSYTREGLPGFNPIQDYVNYDVRIHHTNMDTYERVRPADLQQCAIVMASFAYHAAMRAEKIPRMKTP